MEQLDIFKPGNFAGSAILSDLWGPNFLIPNLFFFYINIFILQTVYRYFVFYNHQSLGKIWYIKSTTILTNIGDKCMGELREIQNSD